LQETSQVIPLFYADRSNAQVPVGSPAEEKRRKSVLILFCTRPEVVKFAPVIRQLEQKSTSIRTINIASGQHADLVIPFIDMFGIRVDFDLRAMTTNQNAEELLNRIVRGLTDVVNSERPDLIVVQGDTTTALGGAVVGERLGVPVAHVEAGLRSGNILSPYPEEMNRISISRLATLHFAATKRNRDALLREGISASAILVTGNPIVDALRMVLREIKLSCDSDLLQTIAGRKCIVLTTHRRESFGKVLRENLEVLRAFVQKHEDLILVFPVHPNPNVQNLANEILAGQPRIVLTPPLPYGDFIRLLARCWLVVSDSGGVQEEVPSLGKPLLIMRDTTERPECIEAGVARLVGGRSERLAALLDATYEPNSWANSVHETVNPFGAGDSAERIVNALSTFLEKQSMPHFEFENSRSGFVPLANIAGSFSAAELV
jgi:UDP-N-acetylglucosamine 2-epimerase (non-hydrolysing)